MTETLLTYRQAADRLNISERTLRRMIPDKLSPVILGVRTIRFKASDVAALYSTTPEPAFNVEAVANE